MKKYWIPLIISVIIVSACGLNQAELAKVKFNKAEQLFVKKKYNDAKLEIDSIKELFPEQIEYVTKSNNLLRKITIEEQQQSLIFLDSMLVIKETELKPLMKNFIISSDYGSEKILIHKRQKPENSYARIYLRAHLNLDGDFFISSRYTGSTRIYHNQIKVYFNKNNALSEIIEEDGRNNRQFEDGENHWEVVNYKGGKDNGVIDFIANNWNQPLKVQFRGKKYHYILMEGFDKEAIRDGYEISFVLKEVKRIKEEKKKIEKELRKLNA